MMNPHRVLRNRCCNRKGLEVEGAASVFMCEWCFVIAMVRAFSLVCDGNMSGPRASLVPERFSNTASVYYNTE
ncbi:hypothetical protein QQF64_008174 [Cirrhinus molitorella]|uniref:Uncharacterized protein n=1 Tax=Cirrhinus molitorella TaxID=172907 RepID=A0ABR3M5E2_9TELE